MYTHICITSDYNCKHSLHIPTMIIYTSTKDTLVVAVSSPTIA